MGTKNNPGKFDCHAKAAPDEPIFTLLGRDPSAADLVEAWANIREEEIKSGGAPLSDREKVAEARQCAEDMRTYAFSPLSAMPEPETESEPA